MCRERELDIDHNQVDNTANEQYNQLLEQLRKLDEELFINNCFSLYILKIIQLNELLLTTAHLQEESERLEDEARKLIHENIQVQIEARLLKDKYRHRRRYSVLMRKKRFNFQQLKQQLQRQRRNFIKFERRLRAKYEQPLRRIVSNTTGNEQRQRCRRIRSMPSESVD